MSNCLAFEGAVDVIAGRLEALHEDRQVKCQSGVISQYRRKQVDAILKAKESGTDTYRTERPS